MIQGVGLFACWPYGTRDKMKESGTEVDGMAAASVDTILENESEGAIEPTSNIASQAVYIWSGLKDKITPPEGQ